MTESYGKKRLTRTVLSEQIKEQLMEDIFHKKYKAGDRIVESALARELGVSQASVREALRSLIAMGFLENEPFKGTAVRSLRYPRCQRKMQGVKRIRRIGEFLHP
jgi:DNA-binding GntR family transcriptional regulator